MRRLRLPFFALLGALLATAALPAVASARTGSCLLRASSPKCQIWFGTVTFLADGDTVSVDIEGDGKSSRRVRVTGIQAMEQSVYPARASQRRGDCHAVEATQRLEQLLRASKMRVRLAAQDPGSRSGSRLRRSIAVKIDHRWRDVGRILLTEGHALWLPNHVEYAWNRDYSVLAARAARLGVNLWNPDVLRPWAERDGQRAHVGQLGRRRQRRPRPQRRVDPDQEPRPGQPAAARRLVPARLRPAPLHVPRLGDGAGGRRGHASTTGRARPRTPTSTGACRSRPSRTSPATSA